MSSVRRRNESAWLLPAAPGSNHRLRADMRTFDDGDEVDIVAVPFFCVSQLRQGTMPGVS